MATTTTTTSVNRAKGKSLGELLGPSIPPPRFRSVWAQLVNGGTTNGAAATKKRITFDDETAAAVAVAEDTTYNSPETLGSTVVDVTVADNAIKQSRLTKTAIAKLIPGMTHEAVMDMLKAGDEAMMLAVLGGWAHAHRDKIYEKHEADIAALAPTLTAQGGDETHALGLADLLAGAHQLSLTKQYSDLVVGVLSPKQVNALRIQIAITGGGLAGAAWETQLDARLANVGPNVGYQGTVMGIPIYQMAHDVVPGETIASIACEDGAVFVPGLRSDPEAPGAPISPFVDVLDAAGVADYLDVAVDGRAGTFTSFLPYGVAVLRQASGAKLVSPA